MVADDRPHQYTQLLVLKHFDRPSEDGGHRWVLAHLYRDPKDKEWPWRGPMRIPPPLGERVQNLTQAQMFGWAFFSDPPTDDQIQTFLHETLWTPTIGPDRGGVLICITDR